jgi:tryptophan synthase alpha chain
MVNRVDRKFKELRKKRKKAFIAFIMAGDPTPGTTKKLVFELERHGVDIIELGVPFSDPLADGPTIQRSSERALKNNKTNLNTVFNIVKSLRLKTDIPICFLTYYNLIYHYGLKRFIDKADSSGVDGIIVPDLPPEESQELRRVAKTRDFSVIHLAAPTSSRKRIRMIADSSSGFIYYVSLTGTTGVRERLPHEIPAGLRKIKAMTKKPVCVGFGISRPEQVRSISRLADGVIVGSAIMKIVEQNLGNKRLLVKRVGNFVKKLICSGGL